MITNSDLLERKRRAQELIGQGNSRGLPIIKIRILSTFNVDLLPPLLAESLERIGVWGEIRVGPFGQVAQQILVDTSELYSQEPDLIVIIPAVEDLLMPLFQRPLQFTLEDSGRLVRERIEELKGLLSILLERLPSATVFMVPFGAGRVPGPHVLHSESSVRGQKAVGELVEAVRHMDGISPKIVTVDWDHYACQAGWDRLSDDRLWYLGRMRLNPLGLAGLSDLIAGHLAAFRGAARKVVAVDLDNTLWGGVVGEAGIQGIVIGNEGVGLAYQDFQRELLKWHDAGILLAVCSKNNPEDAMAAIDNHPDMILRREHFSAMRINWQDKASNLREMSQELNLGIDSFMLLDDNRVERGWVSRALPEVVAPPMPADPSLRPAFVRTLSCVQRITVTEADLQRSQSYQANALRNQRLSLAASFDDYLASLEQEVEIVRLNQNTLARAAQMCQRTNQFNLTTKRYTVAELEAMMVDARTEIFTLGVRDRFENSGITGLAILRYVSDAVEMDTFLLSCRILGRKIEDAFLAYLARRAKESGVSRLIGQYRPTAKNGQTASFYADRGFSDQGEHGFVLSLDGNPLSLPPQIVLKTD